MPRFPLFVTVGLFPVLTLIANGGEGDVWQNWRGPNRDGIVQGMHWPEKLDDDSLRSAWSKELGDSYSGPVFSADAVFTTESVTDKERVYAFDRKTGKLKWEYEWPGSHRVPFFAARNGSWIRSTPATDGNTIYVGGIKDVLVAIDCETGKEKWRVDFAKEAGKVPDFGMVCSPLIDGEYLYIQAGKGVYKLRTSDGSTVWNSMGDSGDMMSSGAFSSPTIQAIHGKRQLVVQTRTTLAGLDLESGKPAWTYEVTAFRGMNILTPTIWRDAIFTSSYGGRSLLLDVPGTGSVNPRWENKIEGYMSSPVVLDHFVYLHLRNKRFACIDLETGKEQWVTKPFGEYWSMVSNGDRILALDQNGKLRLIAHNPIEFELLGERRMSEDETWAHIAISNGQVAIRSQKKLELFDWK